MSFSDLDDSAWQRHPLFREAPHSARRTLAAAATHECFAPGDSIAEEAATGPVVRVLLEGVARVYAKTEHGLEHTLSLLVAPGLIGDPTTARLHPPLEQVQAESACVVATLPASVYLRFLAEQPQALCTFARHLAVLLARRSRLEMARHASVEERLADFLLALARVFGVATADGEHLALAFSQERLARSLGVVRRSVAAAFSRWGKLAIVERLEERVLIRDRAALARIATPVWSAMVYRCGDSMEDLENVVSRYEDTLEVTTGRHAGRRLTVIESVIIGHSPDVDLPIPDVTASPRHARIYRTSRGGRIWIEDLSSTNGTMVGGKRINRACLEPGDEVVIGATHVRLVRVRTTC